MTHRGRGRCFVAQPIGKTSVSKVCSTVFVVRQCEQPRWPSPVCRANLSRGHGSNTKRATVA
eukprot:2684829-Lingulodinium_polyedra.AAC.1